MPRLPIIQDSSTSLTLPNFSTIPTPIVCNEPDTTDIYMTILISLVAVRFMTEVAVTCSLTSSQNIAENVTTVDPVVTKGDAIEVDLFKRDE